MLYPVELRGRAKTLYHYPLVAGREECRRYGQTYSREAQTKNGREKDHAGEGARATRTSRLHELRIRAFGLR